MGNNITYNNFLISRYKISTIFQPKNLHITVFYSKIRSRNRLILMNNMPCFYKSKTSVTTSEPLIMGY